MPQKRLTTNGNVFRRTDSRWQSVKSVIWYFDEHGIKRRKVFSNKTGGPEENRELTELYYVKKDTSRLSGITNGFNL